VLGWKDLDGERNRVIDSLLEQLSPGGYPLRHNGKQMIHDPEFLQTTHM